MRIELKESEDKGFIIDVFVKGEIVKTATYWYDDLEEDFREYLKDMANDGGCDITTIEDWYDWIKAEKELLKEMMARDFQGEEE